MKRIVTIGLLVALFLMSGAILQESRSHEPGRDGSPGVARS
jgi:hypothetical protein